jgi:hypothetical protein
MAKQITLRGVPKELSRQLTKLAELRKQRVDTTQ